MAFFEGAKSALHAFRNFTTTQQGSRIRRPGSSILAYGLSKRALEVAPCPLVFRRLSRYGVICRNWCNPFSNGAKRFYSVDRCQVQHIKPREPNQWSWNPRKVLLGWVLVGSVVFVTVYFGYLEDVPYTKRRHYVPLSRDDERTLGETQFEEVKASFEGKILPSMHPKSVRVRLIAEDIIEALQRGLRNEQGRERESKPASSHLEGPNWEVLVVNEPSPNAFCLPSGKIVVYTGLLEHFRTDAEIATIIAHEMAHVVARHAAEMAAKALWFETIEHLLCRFAKPERVDTMSFHYLWLPMSRKLEIEADYIGLLLMASAGYDPRVASKVYEKFDKSRGDSAGRDHLSTHPSTKKRAQLLAQAPVLEEALTLYRNNTPSYRRAYKCKLRDGTSQQ